MRWDWQLRIEQANKKPANYKWLVSYLVQSQSPLRLALPEHSIGHEENILLDHILVEIDALFILLTEKM